MSDGTGIDWAARPSTIDPRGYVLVRFPDHPRADVRGYVYEHLLVAERTLGRSLRDGERVRHLDNQPGNNRPENLAVQCLDYESTAPCACGCGTVLTRLDSTGRERRYVSGHNPMPSPTRDAILAALAASPVDCLTTAAIMRTTRLTRPAARVALSKLTKAGKVERPRVGYYRLPGSTAAFPPVRRPRPKCELGAGLRPAVKEALTEDFGGLCAYGCGRPATAWDHLIPWTKGGSFKSAGNAVPACDPCNQSKNDGHPGPWVARALAADYSADAMENVICVAIAWGMADPDDFWEDDERGNVLDGQVWEQFPDDVKVRT